jgi:hypothetical protein
MSCRFRAKDLFMLTGHHLIIQKLLLDSPFEAKSSLLACPMGELRWCNLFSLKKSPCKVTVPLFAGLSDLMVGAELVHPLFPFPFLREPIELKIS